MGRAGELHGSAGRPAGRLRWQGKAFWTGEAQAERGDSQIVLSGLRSRRQNHPQPRASLEQRQLCEAESTVLGRSGRMSPERKIMKPEHISVRQRKLLHRLLHRDLRQCTSSALTAAQRMGWIYGLSGGYELTSWGRKAAEYSEQADPRGELELQRSA